MGLCMVKISDWEKEIMLRCLDQSLEDIKQMIAGDLTDGEFDDLVGVGNTIIDIMNKFEGTTPPKGKVAPFLRLVH